MLCVFCLRVFNQPANHLPNGKWSAQVDWTTSLFAVRLYDDCVSCQAIVRGLRGVELPLGDDTTVAIRAIFFSPRTHGGCIESMPYATFTVSDAATKRRLCGTQILLEQVDEKGDTVLLRKVHGTTTGSPEALSFIKTNLQTCLDSHEACRAASAQTGWYPTRLIRVDGSHAQLVITAETPPDGPYASLSHRWGGADIIKCTQKTLPELKKGLPSSSLPATFRDALGAIRFLGIGYIWIDSLCIVQDSASDWAAESKTMLGVYRHSVVNLAATCSRDSHSGLFSTRAPRGLHSGPFSASNGAVSGSFVAVEAALDADSWTAAVENAPLNARAWVLQERLLSPRVAHFARAQVLWDCPGLAAAETLPSGARAMPHLFRRGVGRKRGSNLLHVPAEPDRALGQWAAIVDAYSRCGLTFASDRVVAISGVVEHLRARSADRRFFCGLWGPRMEMQLCWLAASPGAAGRYGWLPSWSWMSVDGAVDAPRPDAFEGYDVTLFAEVRDVVVEADGGGRLRLRCVTRPVGIETRPTLRLVGAGMDEFRSLALDVASPPELNGRLFFVPVFGVQEPAAVSTDRAFECRGLLLEQVDKSEGLYERRGHVFILAKSDSVSGTSQEITIA
ncbi:hypothetical protein Cob_v007652 [Colletotrichum orbiculare MAFF 240422]|uniref:Heterokaryon incompatibility domain-containing protein n=1 Tax=Colletotrichum orbiculare (strain 104-T / ATCC 96160 / CBS 514.97 / LARS 414 / MAFF 240422) TaxID=1213857 RepID=A0A484FP83_COLOR|nr:hypothetical protein Cob_v007652 [Colletotrichum orbiculare MAFF 240422]